MPGFFLNFFPLSVKDFQNVLRLQRAITLRHSIGFQFNLVHEQTSLSPTSYSKKYMTCSFRFCTTLVSLKNVILQITRRVLDFKSEEFGFGYLIKYKN